VYCQIAEFHADINLIFLNSYKYNPRHTSYFQAAVKLEDYYQQLLREAEECPEEYVRGGTIKQKHCEVDYADEENGVRGKKKVRVETVRRQLSGKSRENKNKGICSDVNNISSVLSDFNNEFQVNSTYHRNS
jgi:hypothetical protein